MTRSPDQDLPDDSLPTGAGIRIRKGGVADLAQINRVIALARDGWDLPERVRRLAGRLHELEPSSFLASEVLVAEEGGIVRGVAVAVLRPPRLDDGSPGTQALWLEGLFVDPQVAGRGIGRRLLDAVVALAVSEGLARVDLRAWRDAVGFFRRHGFLPLGPDDARHAMTRPLPSAVAAQDR